MRILKSLLLLKSRSIKGLKDEKMKKGINSGRLTNRKVCLFKNVSVNY
ncbi:MAG: hypothetical protein QXJ96_03635 [Candidatus Aenigmatarchaeota archaeon]